MHHQAFPALLAWIHRALPGRARKSGRLRVLLECAIQDLEALNQRTEEDFLATGGKLMEFSSAAREISSAMTALSEMISGDRGRRASAVLTRVLAQLQQSRARLEAGGEALAQVCAAARAISSAFGDLRDTVYLLRAVGSLTRIETARLGHTGAEFGGLAEEVKALTGTIQTSGQGILETAAVLDREMQSAISEVSRLRTGAFEEMPELFAAATASFASLEERHARAREASLRQAAGYADISAAVEDLVSAIQFHDITRQRIEHVADALRRLVSETPQFGGLGPEASAALKLQSAQLCDTEGVFAASVGRIEQDLDRMAQRVAAMAGESGTLLGLSADERDSFFRQMESRFGAILRILGACSQAESQTRSALAGLAQSVTRMRESLANVGDIAIRLHRMAINAGIRATQIGAAGRALDVLAELMQRLARDTHHVTGEVTGALEAITGAARTLDVWPELSPADAGQVLSELRNTVLELHSASASSGQELSRITVLSSHLCEGIRSLQSGFSAGTLFTEAVGRARAALGEIAVPDSQPPFGDPGPPPEHSLEDFAQHYTMQSEREVHRAIISRPEAPPGGAVMAPVEPAGDDLGDNVELF